MKHVRTYQVEDPSQTCFKKQNQSLQPYPFFPSPFIYPNTTDYPVPVARYNPPSALISPPLHRRLIHQSSFLDR